MNEQISPNESGVLGRPPLSPVRVAAGEGDTSARGPLSPGRVVNVEIGELILDGFGPLDPRTAGSRTADSGRPGSAGPYPARAAAALRRELARSLGDAVPDAEQLAAAIAGAVFRQLAAERQQRFPPRVRHRMGAELSAGTASGPGPRGGGTR